MAPELQAGLRTSQSSEPGQLIVATSEPLLPRARMWCVYCIARSALVSHCKQSLHMFPSISDWWRRQRSRLVRAQAKLAGVCPHIHVRKVYRRRHDKRCCPMVMLSGPKLSTLRLYLHALYIKARKHLKWCARARLVQNQIVCPLMVMPIDGKDS